MEIKLDINAQQKDKDFIGGIYGSLDKVGFFENIKNRRSVTIENVINGIFNELSIELTDENYKRISRVGGNLFSKEYFVLDLGKKEQLFLFSVEPVITNLPQKVSYDMHFESKFNLSNYIKNK